MSDAHNILLSDFGEAFDSASIIRKGKECNTPLGVRPPEARFEPDSPLSSSADIWSLAIAIWEIIGMKSMFSLDYVSPDEMVSQHIDTLGPMPVGWWEAWEGRDKFFHEDGTPKDDGEA